MEIDYGEKRSQIIIAGILILCVVSIFVGFALVIGVSQTNPQNGILQIFDKVLHNSDIGLINYDTDVSAGKYDCIDDVPTAAGEISLLSANFPPESWMELPLCIKDSDIANWNINLYVTGGYEPVRGCITFTQCGEEQYIYINWAETEEYCCYSVWTASFVTDDGCIQFLSSEDPLINLPFDYNYCGDMPDCKLVDICWCTSWTGCEFCIMLTHKKYRNPPISDFLIIANCESNI